MLSGDALRAKAKWYRAMADREVGADRDKMLVTAQNFDDRATARDARMAAAAGQLRLRRARRR